MSATLSVATWNLQWKRPETLACRTMIARLIEHDPDILCLTEAYAATELPVGHAIEAEPDYGYPLVEGRRKVMVWSKQPWTEVDTIGHPDVPPGRFVSGRTATALGPVTVIGVCIPWRDAHVSSGRRDRTAWEDHRAYLAGLTSVLAAIDGPAIVMGDLNQAIPRRTAPAGVFAALEQALGSRFAVATGGPVPPLERPSIDHIAHSRELSAIEVAALSNVGPEGQLLSDHFGVAVVLGET